MIEGRRHFRAVELLFQATTLLVRHAGILDCHRAHKISESIFFSFFSGLCTREFSKYCTVDRPRTEEAYCRTKIIPFTHHDELNLVDNFDFGSLIVVPTKSCIAIYCLYFKF